MSAPPTPSSTTSTTSSSALAADVDRRRCRVRVLADVGEALGDDVVGGDLDRLVAAGPRRSTVEPDRDRSVRGERLERDRQPVPAEHRRVQAARDVAQLLERERDLASRPTRAGACASGSPSSMLLEQAELERERDQPLLGAVVEVALEPLALLLSGLDHAPARAPQLLEPRLQLGLQARVLERDRGGRADRIEQLRLVVQRRVVDQRRHGAPSRSISVTRSAGLGLGQLHRVAVEIGPALELRQPVGERQRRVAQRSGERFCGDPVGARSARRRTSRSPTPDAREARVQQPDQERERREPDDHEGHPADRLECGQIRTPPATSSAASITSASANESTNSATTAAAGGPTCRGGGRRAPRCRPARTRSARAARHPRRSEPLRTRR